MLPVEMSVLEMAAPVRTQEAMPASVLPMRWALALAGVPRRRLGHALRRMG